MKIRLNVEIETDAYTVPEAAGLLGHPRMWMNRLVWKKEVVAIRLGRLWLIPRSEVDRLREHYGLQL